MKKILLTDIFLIFLGLSVEAFTLGDINGDHGVTIIDALTIAQHSVGLNPSAFNAIAADMNWDGRADILDALLVAQYSVFAMKDFSVFVFSQVNPAEEDPQVYDVCPEMNIRATQKWSYMGDEASEYNMSAIKRYHNNNIYYIGGGTASQVYERDFSSRDVFLDMITRDANNQLVPHDEVVPGAYRGSLANPKYRKYIVDFCKIQIDLGMDGAFLDEITGGFGGGNIKNWNNNEGFEDYTIADFNEYLIEKYPDYTAHDWKNNFDMTDANMIKKEVSPKDLVNNFNYRTYLQAHGWNGDTAENGPMVSANPLAKEWGTVIPNRMYRSDNSFLGKYLVRYWQEIVNEIRSYAKAKGKSFFITSNGIFPFVDFNVLGFYDWNPDDQVPDGTGADYVPVTGGHLNGAKSLMTVYKMLYIKSHETSGNVPLVTFIDWPCEMMTNYNALPLQEKKDYWQIFGAEAFACGLYPAFHLKDTTDQFTATAVGTLDFFKTYQLFYKNNKDIYNMNYYYADIPVTVNKSNIAQNLMKNTDGKYVLHLINHNYNNGISLQQNFSVTINLNKTPQSVYMISPDFDGKKSLSYEYKNNQLTINVDKLTYYDVIVIE